MGNRQFSNTLIKSKLNKTIIDLIAFFLFSKSQDSIPY